MARGRQAKQLPDSIEAVGDGRTRLFCGCCRIEFQRGSLAGHTKSAGHQKARHAIELEERERREIDSRANAVEEEVEELEFAALHAVAPTVQAVAKKHSPKELSAQEQELWDKANDADFSMDVCEEDERRERARFNQALDTFGIWDPEGMATALGYQIGNTDADAGASAFTEEDAFLADLLENIDIHAQSESAIPGTERETHAEKAPSLDVDPLSPTYPYPNYTSFLCDVLDKVSPRTPISDSLMRLFLWVLREAGVKDAPTLHYLRSLQAKIRQLCGIPTIPFRSPLGNVFWMVDIRAVLAKDYSNKDTRTHLQVYPEIRTDGHMSEVWHGSKWHGGYDLSQLSPMYDAGAGYHYYVNEVTLCTSGDLVVPFRWVVFRGEVHAEAHPVVFNDQHQAIIDTNSQLRIPVHELAANFFDLEHDGKVPQWADDKTVPEMPNPLREIAGGEPLYSSFVNHFADDVSGNRSKSWNKHLNAYITHANLPRKFLQQESHCHFVSTSPHASAAEQFFAFKQIVEATHTNPVRTHDALTDQPARFRVFVNAEPSDNPMQSEISGHIGGNGNLGCRKCDAGGTKEAKETDEGFHMLFSPGTLRTKEGILNEVRAQVRIACTGIEKHVTTRQRQTGVKDTYTQYWIDDLIKRARTMKQANPDRSEADIQAELVAWAEVNADKIYNPFFTLSGLDPTLDTPIEILHTVLLGVVKYAWHWSHTSWSADQKTIYSTRLQATDTKGLTIHAIRANYIMQYANSLIGRQLKTVAQATVFQVHDILSQPLVDLWVAIGEMTALIWFPVIEDKETYKDDLRVAIANVLDAFSAIDASKILEKLKLHLLVHAPDDIDRFGPLIAMCTELFEAFNGVFRYASIHSNHQAPSRDIARELADQEALRHRLTGGTWSDRGQWRRAGSRVLDFLRDNPNMRRLVGWSPEESPLPGSFKLRAVPESATERPTTLLRDTEAQHALNSASYDLGERFTWCRNVVSQAEDVCVPGSWVCAQSPLQPETVVLGRITQLLAGPNDTTALVILDVFEVAATRHPVFNMPVLARRQGEASYVIIKSPDVRFSFNVQHDCQAAKCAATGVRSVAQERQKSDRTEAYIEHQDFARYVVNLHSLHNPHLIRAVLPRQLTAPIRRTEEMRRNQHDENAQSLRAAREKKKAAKQAKKARKKAKKNSGKAQETAEEQDAVVGTRCESNHPGAAGSNIGEPPAPPTAVPQEDPQVFTPQRRSKRRRVE